MDATTLKMNYVIKFVAEMDRAVKFYRDALGLPPKFQSPGWSEFATGETMLALHPADGGHIAGTVQLGFTEGGANKFYNEMSANRGGAVSSQVPRNRTESAALRDRSPRSAAMHPHFAAPTGIMACS